MQQLTLSVSRRRNQVVILRDLSLVENSATRIDLAGIAKRIVRSVFSAQASYCVGAAAVAAIWWHNLTIADAVAAGEAAALDCLLALPWGMAAIIRSWCSAKGGEL